MAGFTVIETVIVLVVLAVLGAIALPRAYDSGALTLRAQARNFASELHHAQLLAITAGIPVTTTINGNHYTVQYSLNGASVIVVDVNMVNDAIFSPAGPYTLTFDSLGQAQGTLAFGLSSSNASASVNVTATTGLISVQ